MVKVSILIVTLFLSLFCSSIFTLPINKIDTPAGKGVSPDRDFPGRNNAQVKPKRHSTSSSSLRESRERHRLTDINNGNIEIAEKKGGLTEAQQKEVDKYHARIRQRVQWSIGAI